MFTADAVCLQYNCFTVNAVCLQYNCTKMANYLTHRSACCTAVSKYYIHGYIAQDVRCGPYSSHLTQYSNAYENVAGVNPFPGCGFFCSSESTAVQITTGMETQKYCIKVSNYRGNQYSDCDYP